jgi:hypothetical protein
LPVFDTCIASLPPEESASLRDCWRVVGETYSDFQARVSDCKPPKILVQESGSKTAGTSVDGSWLFQPTVLACTNCQPIAIIGRRFSPLPLLEVRRWGGYQCGSMRLRRPGKHAARAVKLQASRLNDVSLLRKSLKAGFANLFVFLSLTNAQGRLTGYIYCKRFDNESEAIARIPFQVASNTYLITASEVASVDFTRIVVPSRWI